MTPTIPLEQALQQFSYYGVVISEAATELTHAYYHVDDPRPLTTLLLQYKESGLQLMTSFLDYTNAPYESYRVRSDVFDEIRTILEGAFDLVAKEVTNNRRIERVSCIEDTSRGEMTAMYEEPISKGFFMLRVCEIGPGRFLYNAAIDLPQKDCERLGFRNISDAERRRVALAFIQKGGPVNRVSVAAQTSPRSEAPVPPKNNFEGYVAEDPWA
jgi:hypothetical protein